MTKRQKRTKRKRGGGFGKGWTVKGRGGSPKKKKGTKFPNGERRGAATKTPANRAALSKINAIQKGKNRRG